MYLDQSAECEPRPANTQDEREMIEKRMWAEKQLWAEKQSAYQGMTLGGGAITGAQIANSITPKGFDLILSRLANLIDFLDTSTQKLEMFNNRVLGCVPCNPSNTAGKDHQTGGAIYDIANKLTRLDELANNLHREVERTQEIG